MVRNLCFMSIIPTGFPEGFELFSGFPACLCGDDISFLDISLFSAATIYSYSLIFPVDFHGDELSFHWIYIFLPKKKLVASMCITANIMSRANPSVFRSSEYTSSLSAYELVRVVQPGITSQGHDIRGEAEVSSPLQKIEYFGKKSPSSNSSPNGSSLCTLKNSIQPNLITSVRHPTSHSRVLIR